MKVCKKHKIILREGMTYQLVDSKDCEVCRLLDYHDDIGKEAK